MQNPGANGPDPVAVLEESCGVVEAIIAQITPDQMSMPTVNDEWDVRDVINHLVRGNIWTVQNLETGGAPRPDGDAIGDVSPAQAFSESAEAMIKAFRAPGALGTMVAMPFGEMPGAGLAMFRFGDLIGHAWDLAQATGQDTNVAPHLSEQALAMARQRLEGMDRAQTPFKAIVVVAETSCAADRLAGYLGKSVTV
ncbi:MAG: TIGR03086 family protein [Thermomicrobiales bacterium]|nr:TIGR03086 family protein [Thermomicrobiales bacterium]